MFLLRVSRTKRIRALHNFESRENSCKETRRILPVYSGPPLAYTAPVWISQRPWNIGRFASSSKCLGKRCGLRSGVVIISIDGPLQRWLASYLDAHSLQCIVGGRMSSAQIVPQGSILGPMLFPANVSEAPHVLADCTSLEAFADDTTFYSLVTSQHTRMWPSSH